MSDPYDPDPDPRDDAESYAEHVADCARFCRCCSLCSQCPCDACLAGGVCDEVRCECGEEWDPMEDEMRERPILFSGPMVRAILAGTKTQTRRLVTAATSEVGTGEKWSGFDFSDAFVDPGGTPIFGPGPYLKVKHPSDDTRHRIYPRYEIGQRLWVRETFAGPDIRGCIAYRARGDVLDDGDKWRPSIFMRRHDSRLTLEVTGIRVERLQEITEADAIAEGVERACQDSACREHDARSNFAALWDQINGKRAPWSINPWVWVVSFKQITEAGRLQKRES